MRKNGGCREGLADASVHDECDGTRAAPAHDDPLKIAILMGRDRSRDAKVPHFDPDNPEARLCELARQALECERQVLSELAVEEILSGKFGDPMLALYGAHLLLRMTASKESSEKLSTTLSVIIRNLRKLLGREHPDVEALALRQEKEDSRYEFRVPPMLRQSWRLVVEATLRKPELVPIGSLASQVADHLLADEPWLVWSAPRGSAIWAHHPVGSTLETTASAILQEKPSQPISANWDRAAWEQNSPKLRRPPGGRSLALSRSQDLMPSNSTSPRSLALSGRLASHAATSKRS